MNFVVEAVAEVVEVFDEVVMLLVVCGFDVMIISMISLLIKKTTYIHIYRYKILQI